MTEDPLQWWSAQENFRLLWPLARMVLGIPASNASAERLFSSAGFLAEGRDRLEIDTLEELAVVRHFQLSSPRPEREALIASMTERMDELPFDELG